jgi:N-acetylglucosaminyldiphosphoundecaprenol N-acetyl-beta-D-mannosaminyltransferase
MTKRVQLFGIEIDAVDMRGAIAQLWSWIDEQTCSGTRESSGDSPEVSRLRLPCKYVVTPNVDHTVLLSESPRLHEVYRDAGLVLADGWPVVLAARLLRKRLPERVAGSDLVPALCKAAQQQNRPLKLFLLGAMPGVAEQAKANIEARWPVVNVVGLYSPPLGFEKNDAENTRILQQVADARPDVLVVGLGAPKQEYWVHEHFARIAAPVALCVGATIDFLAGNKKRAPRWLRRLGLEWLHRMASEPKRLAKRYLRDAWIFPQLVWREWRAC